MPQKEIRRAVVEADIVVEEAQHARKLAWRAYQASVRKVGTDLRKRYVVDGGWLVTEQANPTHEGQQRFGMRVRYSDNADLYPTVLDYLRDGGWIIVTDHRAVGNPHHFIEAY